MYEQNLIDIILKEIKVKKWCFNYGGACSTCGMQDVKRYLENYSFAQILNAFETYDYCKYISFDTEDGIKKLYSLITGNYYEPAKQSNFDFVEFEKRLLEKHPRCPFVRSVTFSNEKSYSEAWIKSLASYEQNLLEQNAIHNEKKYKYRQKAYDEHFLRSSQYRKELVSRLFDMNLSERINYLADDEIHTIKFYPAYLVRDAIGNLEKFDEQKLKIIYKKMSYLKSRNGPWSRFKQNLQVFCKEKFGYKQYPINEY